jgi:ABC-type Fe3+-siderophore transport system permease subunit
MKLDLRLPMGLMFTIVGALLVLFGLVSDNAIYARSLGINVNLWWGLVLLAFGLVMLWLAAGAARKGQRQP